MQGIGGAANSVPHAIIHGILKNPAVLFGVCTAALQLHAFSILLPASMPSEFSCFRVLSTDQAGLLRYYAKISGSTGRVTRGAQRFRGGCEI